MCEILPLAGLAIRVLVSLTYELLLHFVCTGGDSAGGNIAVSTLEMWQKQQQELKQQQREEQQVHSSHHHHHHKQQQQEQHQLRSPSKGKSRDMIQHMLREWRPQGCMLTSPAMDVSSSACFHDLEWVAQHEAR